MKSIEQFQWTLVGIPDHAGVLNVGGRIGSALGPQAFRENFARLKGQVSVQKTLQDSGDVRGLTLHGPGSVEIHHELAARHVQGAAKNSQASVIVGGGHDHGYSHLRGIAEAFPGKALGCINIDAHLDVRKPAPEISSGSPFYLALESGVIAPERFIEFGIQSHCNAPELWDYIDAKKVRTVPYSGLRGGWRACMEFKAALGELAHCSDLIVVSLDLDALASAFAPGVSAPQAEGFSSSEIIEMMEEAGRAEKVVSLGIFELNPVHDEAEKTARLAATAAWHFIEQRIRRFYS